MSEEVDEKIELSLSPVMWSVFSVLSRSEHWPRGHERRHIFELRTTPKIFRQLKILIVINNIRVIEV